MKENSNVPTSLAAAEKKIDQDWLLVQPGLFDYPRADGEEPALLANRCRHCGTNYFPKRATCPHCVKKDMEDITLSRRGIIYASTAVYIDSPVGIKAPYAFGYVDIPENKIRVFALFAGGDPSSFVPGSEVELSLGPVRQDGSGKDIIGYTFRRLL
jgi:uncharacterized protein